MSTHSTNPLLDAAGSDPAIVVERCTPTGRRAALALLLTGSEQGDVQAVDNFLEYVREHRLSVDDLWLARRNGAATAALLLVPAAGRSAMVFVSPVRTGAAAAVPALARAACAAADPARVCLVQAILDPWQLDEARGLEAAGFRNLATLVYMQRSVPRGARPPTLDSAIQVRHWSEANRLHFERAILASYEKTLDCPGLLGLRSIGDVITGHMASGVFDPTLWITLTRGDEPVAVMLLSQLPTRGAVELVYLGLSPAWRGKGWGRRLMDWCFALCADRGADSVLLAVDDRNGPAVRLYDSLGFLSHARKLAMIQTLPLRQVGAS